MKLIIIQAYTFDELSPEAQEIAWNQWYIAINQQHWCGSHSMKKRLKREFELECKHNHYLFAASGMRVHKAPKT